MSINNTTIFQPSSTSILGSYITNPSITAGTVFTNNIYHHRSNNFSIPSNLYILPFSRKSALGSLLFDHIKDLLNDKIYIIGMTTDIVSENTLLSAEYYGIEIDNSEVAKNIVDKFNVFYNNDFSNLLPHKSELIGISTISYDIEENYDAIFWLVDNCEKPFYGLGNSIGFDSEKDLIAFKLRFL